MSRNQRISAQTIRLSPDWELRNGHLIPLQHHVVRVTKFASNFTLFDTSVTLRCHSNSSSHQKYFIPLNYSRIHVHGGTLHLLLQPFFPGTLPTIHVCAPEQALRPVISVLYAASVDIITLSKDLSHAVYVARVAHALGVTSLTKAILHVLEIETHQQIFICLPLLFIALHQRVCHFTFISRFCHAVATHARSFDAKEIIRLIMVFTCLPEHMTRFVIHVLFQTLADSLTCQQTGTCIITPRMACLLISMYAQMIVHRRIQNHCGLMGYQNDDERTVLNSMVHCIANKYAHVCSVITESSRELSNGQGARKKRRRKWRSEKCPSSDGIFDIEVSIDGSDDTDSKCALFKEKDVNQHKKCRIRRPMHKAEEEDEQHDGKSSDDVSDSSKFEVNQFEFNKRRHDVDDDMSRLMEDIVNIDEEIFSDCTMADMWKILARINVVHLVIDALPPKWRRSEVAVQVVQVHVRVNEECYNDNTNLTLFADVLQFAEPWIVDDEMSQRVITSIFKRISRDHLITLLTDVRYRDVITPRAMRFLILTLLDQIPNSAALL